MFPDLHVIVVFFTGIFWPRNATTRQHCWHPDLVGHIPTALHSLHGRDGTAAVS